MSDRILRQICCGVVIYGTVVWGVFYFIKYGANARSAATNVTFTLAGPRFKFNDTVYVTRGFFRGHHGKVIAISPTGQLKPDYLVVVDGHSSTSTWVKEPDLISLPAPPPSLKGAGR